MAMDKLDIFLHFAAYAKTKEAVDALEKREKFCLPDPIRRRQINQLKDFREVMLALASANMAAFMRHTLDGLEVDKEVDRMFESFTQTYPIENYTEEWLEPIIY